MEKKSNPKMSVVKGKQASQPEQKLSYEQLEHVANNLNGRCQQLYNDLMEAKRIIDSFNEVGMLLSIINKSEHFEESFISRCTKKIQDTVTAMLDDSEKAEETAEK